MYVDQFVTRMKELGHIKQTDLRPCTEGEVQMLEYQLKHQLPAAYREFLLLMGRGANGLLAGTNCFYEDLLSIQEWSRELLEDNNVPTPLPSDAFVFLMHQGYQFFFMRLSEGNDPAAYYYNETQVETTTFLLKYTHFTEFLLKSLEVDAEWAKRLQR